MTTAHFQRRRQQLAALLPDNCLALLHSGVEQPRNNDTNFPFRVDSSFWYLTGLDEPDSWLVLRKCAGDTESILYVHPQDPQTTRWEGKRLGIEGAATLGCDRVEADSNLRDNLEKLLQGIPECWLLFHQQPAVAMLTPLIGMHNRRKRYPDRLSSLGTLIYQMRWVKDAEELTQLRMAANINALAHIQCMRQCAPGKYEYQLEAAHRYESLQHGAHFQAYNPIVASGGNACILHYSKNNQKLIDGDLVLIDAGCEYNYYASDVTRTFPINGKFTSTQLDLYQLVLLAQHQAITACVTGNTLAQVHQAAVATLTQGLIDLRILHGSLESCLEQHAVKPYYMHGTSHWMGLDVHDPSSYTDHTGTQPKLQEGVVLTVEPGLYFDYLPDLPEPFRGSGIRIEDDILITRASPEILTIATPKLPDDLCAIIGCETGRKPV